MIAKHQKISSKFDNCIILHGCPPNEQSVTPKEHRWMNWLVGKLKEKGINAIAPEMPSSWSPKYTEWKTSFEKYRVTKNSLLIGHSCGAAFLVRWLLEKDIIVKKLILAAAAKIPENETDTRKDLYNFELSNNVPNIAIEIVLFTSNDFPHHLKSLEIYKQFLKPRVITLENKFHFLYFQTKTNEFPELLDEIIKSN